MDTPITTNFSNALVSVSTEHMAPLQKQPIAVEYPGIELLVSLVIVLIAALHYTRFLSQPWWHLPSEFIYYASRIGGAVITIWACLEVYTFFANKRLGFCLREQDITLFKGLLFRKVITQPICRIQHIEVKQGPIDRKVGLAKLHIFSAGDISQTFIIPGLRKTTAQNIRSLILNHKELQQHG